MMKMILICILMTSLSLKSYAQLSDTSYQSISYQKTFLQKGRFELYGWTSYDLFWADETGIGINININKRKRNGKFIRKSINNWDWNSSFIWDTKNFKLNQTKKISKRFEVETKGLTISQILFRNDQ